ncbi:MAG: ComF family protein [Deltaproteobacteria bacterium]|nr:ComF family protein [Deltaproteobacteria bacterium]
MILRAVSSILNFIFPNKCIACRIFSKEVLCASCQEKFPSLPSSYCSLCARPFFSPDPSEERGHLCGDCLVSKPPFEKVYPLGLYQGILADLVGRMKYRKEERIADLLGEWLGTKLQTQDLSIDLIVPVPLHRERLRERGFNQAARISDAIGRILKIPVEKYDFVRVRRTPLQTTLNREERMKNLKEAFQVLDPKKIDGKKLLLVDDVYTTGSTLTAATKALLKVGVQSVSASVVARAV